MRLTFYSAILLLFLASCGGKAIIFDDTKPIHLTEDLIIGERDTLIMLPGAKVMIDTGVNILAFGDVFIRGTAEKPVEIKASDPKFGWGEFRAKGECDQFIIEHAFIEEGQLFSYRTKNHFKNVVFKNHQQLEWNDALARFWEGSVLIEDCWSLGINRGEGFLLHDVEKPIVRNCEFTKIPDAIEYINCNDGQIIGNRFLFMKDDAIDQNSCKRTLIADNKILYVKDCGMELGSEKYGSSDSLIVRNNLFVGCLKGINVKESSFVIAEQNTFFKNEIGIEINTHADSSRASRLEVIRSVFKENKDDFLKVGNSQFSFFQSLSDSIALPGKENLTESVQFMDQEKNNYKIISENQLPNVGYTEENE